MRALTNDKFESSAFRAALPSFRPLSDSDKGGTERRIHITTYIHRFPSPFSLPSPCSALPPHRHPAELPPLSELSLPLLPRTAGLLALPPPPPPSESAFEPPPEERRFASSSANRASFSSFFCIRAREGLGVKEGSTTIRKRKRERGLARCPLSFGSIGHSLGARSVGRSWVGYEEGDEGDEGEGGRVEQGEKGKGKAKVEGEAKGSAKSTAKSGMRNGERARKERKPTTHATHHPSETLRDSTPNNSS